MASKSIDITLINSSIGVAPSADGVCMLVAKGVAVTDKFALGTLYLLTKQSDLDTLGIDAAYDTANNVAIYQHVSEFFGQAGNGAKLWLVGVATNTVYATYLAGDTFKQLVRTTSIADPLNKAKVIGVAYDVPTAGQSSADFPSDVTASIPVLNTALGVLFNEGYEACGVIDGYNMSSTVSVSALSTRANDNAPKVALAITGTKNNRVSSVGLVLGKLARISVGTSIGKVADGALSFTGDAYLTNGITKVNTLTPSEVTALGTKQYLFKRTWLNRSGYYFNDGATCDLAANAFSSIEFNRIANKVASDARLYMQSEIGSNIPVNTSGNADVTYTKPKENQFYNQYLNPLKVSGDISEATITITGVNFVSTRTLNFAIQILPAPALSNVVGTIEFVTTI